MNPFSQLWHSVILSGLHLAHEEGHGRHVPVEVMANPGLHVEQTVAVEQLRQLLTVQESHADVEALNIFPGGQEIQLVLIIEQTKQGDWQGRQVVPLK